MSSSLKLNENNKRIILGLALFPEKSDTFISDKIGVSRSTFTTIKKKICSSSKPLISAINLPNFLFIGAELISLCIFRLNLNKTFKYDPSELLKTLNHFPNIFSVFTDSFYHFVFLISKSFTDMIITHDYLSEFYIEENLIKETDFFRLDFPLYKNGIIRLFEYGRPLSNLWKIAINNENPLSLSENLNHSNLSNISPLGWRIFEELLTNPEIHVSEVMKIVKKPRNTISRWNYKFQKIGLYYKRFIPDLNKLGLKIQVIYSLSVKGLDETEKLEIQKLIDSYFLPVTFFSSQRELLFISIFHDLQSLKDVEIKFISKMNSKNLLLTIDKKIVILLNNIQYLKLMTESFSSLVNYLRNPIKYNIKQYFDKI